MLSSNLLLPLLLLFLLLNRLEGGEKSFEDGLEPGHVKPEYDSVEEVRGHENETETGMERSSTRGFLRENHRLCCFPLVPEVPLHCYDGQAGKRHSPCRLLRSCRLHQPTESEEHLLKMVTTTSALHPQQTLRAGAQREDKKPAEDEHLTREAILDVAYYLRRFKFSGHDPRYLAEGEIPKQNLFVEFPSPPLRNIHWEVRKNCELSFVECVKYLQEQVSQTVLPRHLDSLTITKQNGWSFITDRDLIKAADDECLRLLQQDGRTFNPFSGPLQRFQWLTSATYYMCLYTMKETAYLRNFTEDCDNFGSCIQWEFGLSNKDVRGDNGRPFACASYSFCPDPCCPLKYLPDWSSCAKASPCLSGFSSNVTCSLVRKHNFNFESLILNQWNISCNCDGAGMRWESKSGMCVDVDECTEPEPPCSSPSETCTNLPGTYKCVCNTLGYRRNGDTRECEPDPVLGRVFNPRRPYRSNETESLSEEFSRKCLNVITKLQSTLMMAFTGNGEPNATKLL